MAVVRDQGKTTFTREVLKKNNQANVKAVNDAWKQAGHEGSISDTLVNKVRSEMKLTGNIRPGRRPGSKAGAASKTKGTTVVKTAVTRGPKANGAHTASPTAPAARPISGRADRARALGDVETTIDRLIFESQHLGGLEQFEDALRRARRILVRSHQD